MFLRVKDFEYLISYKVSSKNCLCARDKAEK